MPSVIYSPPKAFIFMRRQIAIAILALCPLSAFAQMTMNQKIADFQSLAGTFAKRYAFYEWKLKEFRYDGLDLSPWLQKVNATTDDISFFDVCAEYVAAWQDSHAALQLESTWQATLPLTLDVYDGKVVIDTIDRTVLPEKEYPFQVGDALVSLNAVGVNDLMNQILPFAGMANPKSQSRLAASAIFSRDQSWWPRASAVPSYANVEVRHADGSTDVQTLQWNKTGIVYTQTGPVPDIGAPARGAPAPGRGGSRRMKAAAKAPPAVPDYLKRLYSLRNLKAPRLAYVTGEGDLAPFFAMPASFKQRLGNGQFDEYFTGTLTAGTHTVGFIRIPSFELYDIPDLTTEIAWMQANTDGLVVDVTRNPGGDACEAEQTAALMFRNNFQSLGLEIRVTWDILFGFMQDVSDAQSAEASQTDIDQLQAVSNAAATAYKQNRGFTDPMPICGMSQTLTPATDSSNALIGYAKPILILTDDMSASAAELFAAIMQDNKRSTQYGTRTNGAGGTVETGPFAVYMDAAVSLPWSILARNHNVTETGYPTAPYIENIGVWPDQQADFMTMDNLVNNGKPFVDGFTEAIQCLIDGTPATSAAVR